MSPSCCATTAAWWEPGPTAFPWPATHVYDHGSVDLQFWHCQPRPDAIGRAPLGGFQWIGVGQLDADRFPAANAAVIEELLSNSPDESGDQTESTHEA